MKLIKAILLLNLSAVLMAEVLEISVKDFGSQENIESVRATIIELGIQERVNSEGVVVFDIPIGSYSLLVEADGYITTEEAVELPEGGNILTFYLQKEAVLDSILIEIEEGGESIQEVSFARPEVEDLPFEGASPFGFGKLLAGTTQIAMPKLIAGSQLLRRSWFNSAYGVSGSWNRYFYDYLRLPSPLRLSGDAAVPHSTVNPKMVKDVKTYLGFSSATFGRGLGLTQVAQAYAVPKPLEIRRRSRLSSYEEEQIKREKIKAKEEEEKRLQEEERQERLAALPPELQDKNDDGYSDLTQKKLYDVDRDGYPDIAGDIFLDRDQDGFSDLADVPLYDSNLDGKVDFYGDIFLDEDKDGISDLTGVELFDQDGDGVYDIFGDPYRDDNFDGYSDVLGEPLYDLDQDGLYDAYGDILADNNNDGYSDVTGYRLLDSDEDGLYDSLEVIERFSEDDFFEEEEEYDPRDLVDEDNDGISDTLNLPLIDLDNDGVYDLAGYAFDDKDNDGLSDLLYSPLIDIDNDGIYDETSSVFTDEDNDGYSDVTGQYLFDDDGDGVVDTLVDPLEDNDFDGLSDVNGFSLVDLDDDGIYDTYDSGFQLTEWQQGFLHKVFYEDGVGYLGSYRLGPLGLQVLAQQSIDPISTELLINSLLKEEKPSLSGIYLRKILGLDGEAQLRARLKLENHSFVFNLLSYYDIQENKLKFYDSSSSFDRHHTQDAVYFTLGGNWEFFSITNVKNTLSLQLAYYQNKGNTSFNNIFPDQHWTWRYDRESFNIEQLFARAHNETVFPIINNIDFIVDLEQRFDSSEGQNGYNRNIELYDNGIGLLDLPSYVSQVLWHYSAANASVNFSFEKIQIKLGAGSTLIHNFENLAFYPQAEIESWAAITSAIILGLRAAWSHADYDAAEYNRIKLWENGQNIVSDPPSNTNWENLPQGVLGNAYLQFNIPDKFRFLLDNYFGYYTYNKSYFPFATSLRAPDSYDDQLADTISYAIDNQIAFGSSLSFESTADEPLFFSFNYTLAWSLIQLNNQQEWVSADNDVRHTLHYLVGYRLTLEEDWLATAALQGGISFNHPYDPISVVDDVSAPRGGDLNGDNDRQALSQLGEKFNGQRSFIPRYSLFLRLTVEHDYIAEKRKKKIKFFLQSSDLLALLRLKDSDVLENRIGNTTRLGEDRLVSIEPFDPLNLFAFRFGFSWEF